MVQQLDLRLQELPSPRAHEIIKSIAVIDEFKGLWRAHGLPRPLLLAMRKQVVGVSAAASSRLADGRWNVQPHAAGRFESGRSPEAHLAPFVSGYAEVLRAVFDGFAQMPLTEGLILQSHRHMLRYSFPDAVHRGTYKTTHDRASLQRALESPALRPVDPDRTPAAVAELILWTRSRLRDGEFHPLLVIAGFILEFLAIRPFRDGNGRLSRILTNLLLLQSGYSHTSYASLERVICGCWTEYYLALRKSQANRSLPRADISPWLCAFLDAVRAQVAQLRNVVEGLADETLLSAKQLEVMELLERHGEVTNRLIRSELHMPRETAKQVLNRLLALRFVRRIGSGRAARYRQPGTQDCGVSAK